MNQQHIPDINQRDDANDIEQLDMGIFQKWCLRRSARWILTLIIRRLDRQLNLGVISPPQHSRLVNTFRRTFLEDTDA